MFNSTPTATTPSWWILRESNPSAGRGGAALLRRTHVGRVTGRCGGLAGYPVSDFCLIVGFAGGVKIAVVDLGVALCYNMPYIASGEWLD